MDFEQARARLIRDIEHKGIRDKKVLATMLNTSRELFVPENLHNAAYEDKPLQIGFGQTISQPFIVAFMTEALHLTATDHVLEVGTGSAYQTVILSRLAKHIYTVERIPELAQKAFEIIKLLDISNITIHVGDGSLGWREEAPFEKIIVTAVAPSVPQSLLNQLAENGRMVIPVALSQEKDKNQGLILVVKQDGKIKQTKLGECMFVRLIGREGFQ